MHVHSTRAVAREVEALADEHSLAPRLDHLPPAILHFHAQAVQSGARNARVVRLEQQGEMRLGPDKSWQPFLAEEFFAVHNIAFVWQARVHVAPLFSAIVIDRYAHGHGELDARLFNTLRVAHAAGPDTDRGELLRYLAELPWVPQAIAENGALEWQSLDDHEIVVAAGRGAARCSVTLHLDDTGDIVGASAVRPRLVGESAVPTPWAGAFSAYRDFGGMRIPTHAEVWWELPRGRFVYWRGDVTAAETID